MSCLLLCSCNSYEWCALYKRLLKSVEPQNVCFEHSVERNISWAMNLFECSLGILLPLLVVLGWKIVGLLGKQN